MRWLLLVLLGSVPAAADSSCPPATDWVVVKRCLDRRGTVILLEDLPDAKLVSTPLRTGSARIELYQLVDGRWRQNYLAWTTGPGSELLDFGAFKDGAYRVAIGTAYERAVRVDVSTRSVPGVIKRISTSICPRTSACRTIMTSCDLLVRGKLYSWFRGTPVWNGSTLKVNGDASNGGIYCQIAKSQLTREDP